jgi:hypothetical protein
MAGIVARQAGVESHAAVSLAFTGGRGSPLPRTFRFQLPLRWGLREAIERSRDDRYLYQGSGVRMFSPNGRNADSLRYPDECSAGGVGLVLLEFEPADLFLESLRGRYELLAGIARPNAVDGSGIMVVA